MCQNDIANKDTIASSLSLRAFTIEQDEAIYLIGQKNCSFFHSLSLPFSGRGEVFLHGRVAEQTQLVDSFTKFTIAANNITLAFVSSSMAAECTSFSSNVILARSNGRIHLIRMYRRSKQPIPGTFYEDSRVMHCYMCSMLVCYV